VIISHRHRFIYVKCAKVAGSSIEWALSSVCGDEDIITPLALGDGRGSEDGPRGPQNCFGPLFPSSRPWTHADVLWPPHMTAVKIRDVFPREWRDYYTFCTERNPWDRIVSQYYHERGMGWDGNPGVTGDPTLSEAIQGGLFLGRESNWSMYTWDNTILVDHVMRYEDLHGELGRLSDRLGLGLTVGVPHIGGGVRMDARPPNEVLSRADVHVVARACVHEIEEFGYTLEGEPHA
jgi:hypothetical protein